MYDNWNPYHFKTLKSYNALSADFPISFHLFFFSRRFIAPIDRTVIFCRLRKASKFSHHLFLNCWRHKVQDRSHQWSTRPAHNPGRQWLSLDFEILGQTEGRTYVRTTFAKIVITTARNWGRPRGSITVWFWYALWKMSLVRFTHQISWIGSTHV